MGNSREISSDFLIFSCEELRGFPGYTAAGWGCRAWPYSTLLARSQCEEEVPRSELTGVLRARGVPEKREGLCRMHSGNGSFSFGVNVRRKGHMVFIIMVSGIRKTYA